MKNGFIIKCNNCGEEVKIEGYITSGVIGNSKIEFNLENIENENDCEGSIQCINCGNFVRLED